MKLKLSNLRFGASGCVGVCAVAPSDRTHPNKMPFEGTLLILDQPSNKPPHGAEGHRIYVPTAAAKKRLATLINMGVNYQPELAGHAPRHKVGVITGARIAGNRVLVNGFLWQRDFPEVKKDLHAGRLGMSMELQDVSVRNKDAPVWFLDDFHFSGATILFKSAAAYSQTTLSASGISRLGEVWGMRVKDEIRKYVKTALAASAANVRISEGGRMDKAAKKKERHASSSSGQGELLVQAIAAGVGPAISAAIKESLEPFVTVLNKQQASIARIAASVEESKALSIEAAKREDEDEDEIAAAHEDDEMDAAKHEDDDEEEMSAAKKKDEDDDNDDDEDDDAELDAEMEHLEDDHADEEPGEVNEDAENEGDKTTRKGKVGKSKAMKELVKASASKRSISASSVIRELYASHRALRKKYRTLQARASESIESLQNKVEALEAQAEQYAERMDRRSVSAELGNFLSKNNVDVRELRAEGKTLSVGEVDQMFESSPIAGDPTTRMWFKNQLLAAGLMEQGEVHRGLN